MGYSVGGGLLLCPWVGVNTGKSPESLVIKGFAGYCKIHFTIMGKNACGKAVENYLVKSRRKEPRKP